MEKLNKKKKINFGSFVVRTLAVSASTLALYDFFIGKTKAGGLLALGWLAIVIGEKRMFSPKNSNEEIQGHDKSDSNK